MALIAAKLVSERHRAPSANSISTWHKREIEKGKERKREKREKEKEEERKRKRKRD